MDINVIITATKEFKDFLPIVTKRWMDWGYYPILGLVGDFECEYEGFAYRYEEIPGLPSGNYAKVLRTIIASMHGNEACMLTDADMLPLDKDFFDSGLDKLTKDNIVFYTEELKDINPGQYAICYTLAYGSTFGKIVNPDGLLHSQLIEKLPIWKTPFSDETMYIPMYEPFEKVCLGRHHQYRRLCRSNWKRDPNVKYIDAHLPRPFNYEQIKDLL